MSSHKAPSPGAIVVHEPLCAVAQHSCSIISNASINLGPPALTHIRWRKAPYPAMSGALLCLPVGHGAYWVEKGFLSPVSFLRRLAILSAGPRPQLTAWCCKSSPVSTLRPCDFSGLGWSWKCLTSRVVFVMAILIGLTRCGWHSRPLYLLVRAGGADTGGQTRIAARCDSARSSAEREQCGCKFVRQGVDKSPIIF